MLQFQPRASHSVSRYRSLSAWWPTALLYLALVVLAAAWLMVLRSDSMPTIFGPTLTATVAAASLIYSLGRGQDAARDQYTLTLISRRFDDGGYAANMRVANELRLAGQLTPETSLAELLATFWTDPHDDKKVTRASHAIIPILNYWEHVCTAYVDDRINRRIFEDLVQDLIRELVGRFARIIGDMRREDPTNMEHLCAVWFALASAAEHRALAAKLGPVPARLCPHDQWRWQQAAGD